MKCCLYFIYISPSLFSLFCVVILSNSEFWPLVCFRCWFRGKSLCILGFILRQAFTFPCINKESPGQCVYCIWYFYFFVKLLIFYVWILYFLLCVIVFLAHTFLLLILSDRQLCTFLGVDNQPESQLWRFSSNVPGCS